MPPLTANERRLYAIATTDWRPLPDYYIRSALAGLAQKGLIERRVRPQETGALAVAEWRRTPESA